MTRRRWLAGAAFLGTGVLALAGCVPGLIPGTGSGGGSPTTSSAPADSLARQGFPPLEECPSTSAQLNAMNAAAYQVFGQIDYLDQATGQPAQWNAFIGTAWAVDERLLATNAHVAQAFVEAAAVGTQFSRAVAVQSGTGTVVQLLREVTHPNYTGDPLRSPDVALFTTLEPLPSTLDLAPATSILDLGDEFHLTGFPGDVEDFIAQRPGETVPQATSLTGAVSARRAHAESEVVTPASLAVYQHQAPTTPGTSGSAMVHCGLVFAINNAGTVKYVVVPQSNGEFATDRQAAAANNFGVHVRYIHEMLDLFEANAIQGTVLPVPATVVATAGDVGPILGGEEGTEGDDGAVTSIGFDATVLDPFPHVFSVVVDVNTGELVGTATWGSVPYELVGSVDVNTLEFSFVDDAPERDPELPRGFYYGVIEEDGSMYGYYMESDEAYAEFSGQFTG